MDNKFTIVNNLLSRTVLEAGTNQRWFEIRGKVEQTKRCTTLTICPN